MEQMIKAVTSSPLFGIVLCIAAFELGVWLQKKLKTPLCHPLADRGGADYRGAERVPYFL